jgi:hypothetical protein
MLDSLSWTVLLLRLSLELNNLPSGSLLPRLLPVH